MMLIPLVIIGESLYDTIFFFFSSRRRHTRSKRDWSSDVCSSDLNRLLDTRQVVPTVPQRVVLNDELSGNRRAEAQREWCGLVQLIVGKLTNSSGSGAAVAAQEFQRSGLRHACLLASMIGVQVRNNIPCYFGNSLAGGDDLRQVNFYRVNGCNV